MMKNNTTRIRESGFFFVQDSKKLFQLTCYKQLYMDFNLKFNSVCCHMNQVTLKVLLHEEPSLYIVKEKVSIQCC